MPVDDGWRVEHHRGPAAHFHALDPPDPVSRSLWWFEVDGPTVVLGSTLAGAVIDADRARAAGVAVARRRSGGGVVWLAAGDVTWVDLILPAADPRWDHDVVRAARWVGEAWVRALRALGLPGGVVHEGGLVRRPWADLVCFAGLGPGEVTVGGQKVVGVSQRRTRASARFQCAVLHRWDPGPLIDVLALPDPERADVARALGPAAAGLADLGVAATGDAVVACLWNVLE